MHVRPSSNVADHCLSHALSEADSLYFEEECSYHVVIGDAIFYLLLYGLAFLYLIV